VEKQTENSASVLVSKIEAIIENPVNSVVAMDKSLKIGQSEKKGLFKTIIDFIKSYEEKSAAVSDKDWLANELAKYDVWKNKEEIQKKAGDIVDSIEEYESAKRDLQAYKELNKGSDNAGWLTEQIAIGADINGKKEYEEYASEIVSGFEDAIKENTKMVTNGGGK
jgi:hypothetical protein